MKPLALIFLALVLGGLSIGSVLASRDPQQPSYAPPSGLPSGGIELLAAVPFVLDEPFVHEWRAEKPVVSSGYLLVLKADPDLVRPRQTYEAVLYAGSEVAERCNFPENGSHLVALVPAPLDGRGRVALDLDSTPIWFGSLELPERVDAARIADELELARARGIGPVQKSAQLQALVAPPETIYARDRVEL